MKKIAFVMLIALAVTATISAQTYTVQSVTGRVQREAGNSRIDIAVGDVLSADTVIHTGIGAALVLHDGERTVTIPAAQNGKRLAELVTSGSGIRIGGNVVQVDTGAAGNIRGHTQTASTRSAEAAEDDDITAE
ncbi:MAG: hypothetical protein FWG89_10045 [Treponema sp.]|nr:hypothetical protein [Treponema sp.]